MKKLIAAVALITMFGLNVQADTPTTKLGKKVSRMMDFPQKAGAPNEGIVVVELTFTQAGKADIKKVHASDPAFAEHVKAKLSKLTVEEDHPSIGQELVYRFNFRKEK